MCICVGKKSLVYMNIVILVQLRKNGRTKKQKGSRFLQIKMLLFFKHRIQMKIGTRHMSLVLLYAPRIAEVIYVVTKDNENFLFFQNKIPVPMCLKNPCCVLICDAEK